MIAVANAPCSWGVLEFESKAASPGYEQVLDEIAASGYDGTELGDWGFMPTEPAILRERLDRRRLAMVGAFVTTRLADPGSYDASMHTAVETARLLAAVGDGGRPVIVVSDEPTADPIRTGAAGRVQPAMSLTGRQWDDAASGVERIAAAVRDEAGLRTVFHHHCAGYVETPDEIDASCSGPIRRSSACVSIPAMRRTAEARRSSCCRATARGCGTSTSRTASRRSPSAPRQERLDYQHALRRGRLLRAGARQRRFPRCAPRPSEYGLRRLDRRRAGCPAGDGLAGRERDTQPG